MSSDKPTTSLSDIDADRAAVRALVDALPKCEFCSEFAYWQEDDVAGEEPPHLHCDAHKEASSRCIYGVSTMSEFAYAPALRVLLELMKEWER